MTDVHVRFQTSLVSYMMDMLTGLCKRGVISITEVSEGNNRSFLGKWVTASKDYLSYNSVGFANRRKRGKIVGGSRTKDCYAVKWNGMAGTECIHRTKFDFIDPLDEIFTEKVTA